MAMQPLYNLSFPQMFWLSADHSGMKLNRAQNNTAQGGGTLKLPLSQTLKSDTW